MKTIRVFQLCSTNPLYSPYEVHATKILEIWKFVNYISSDMPVSAFKKVNSRAILDLQAEVKHLKNIYIRKDKTNKEHSRMPFLQVWFLLSNCSFLRWVLQTTQEFPN
ncbi:MAG: hypothetical protein IPH66_18090 [Crocinitomicaceae bacterium]|nr:hypothetical protein [Crocinitomicaceae bacterium]